MTVLSGGLEERIDEIAFIAPPSGYEERTFDYSMKKELPGNQWRDEVSKSLVLGDFRCDFLWKSARLSNLCR
jgi:hypothetical protein